MKKSLQPFFTQKALQNVNWFSVVVKRTLLSTGAGTSPSKSVTRRYLNRSRVAI
eukprot:COSAG06_NODE_3062_length_5904_cov_62.822911_2_plen_54_part_00